jgi:diguanylate cyclase (GGDEF)-like protein
MRLRFWLGYAVVAAIAVGSIAVALLVHSRERDNFEQKQRSEAVRSARQAEAVAALSVGQLASAAAFFQAEGNFTRHEFDVVADSLLSTGALAATAFVQSVPHSARARFERSRGFPIVERTALGDFRRAADRRQYFPLVFAETKSPLGVQTPYGFDLGSDVTRARHLLRGRDTGRPAATRVIRLPLGGTGINVFRPVYRDGEPTATRAQRRAALIGFATGSFHLDDLAAAVANTLPDEVDAQLVENGRAVMGPSLSPDDGASAQIRVADRTWLLVIEDPNRPGVGLPILIAVVGIALATLLAALVLIWMRNEGVQELRRQASHDALTGLKNRRRFGEDLHTELGRSRRDKSIGAVLMLDLDNFKQINDTLGHAAGDRVIVDVAGVLSARLRATDVIARLGGDEFAVVLPHCELDEAEEVAEAITASIRLHTPPGEAAPPLTASIGIATFGPRSGSAEEVLAAADGALYEAKRAGRNSVRVASVAVAAGVPPSRAST